MNIKTYFAINLVTKGKMSIKLSSLYNILIKILTHELFSKILINT